MGGIGDERAEERDIEESEGLYGIRGRLRDIEVILIAGVDALVDVMVDALPDLDKLEREIGGSK